MKTYIRLLATLVAIVGIIAALVAVFVDSPPVEYVAISGIFAGSVAFLIEAEEQWRRKRRTA